MAKGQKTKSYKVKGDINSKTKSYTEWLKQEKAKEKIEVIKCNVVKDCKNSATFDFIMACPIDRKAKEYSGCDNCILALQGETNAVLLDGTK